MGGDLFSFIRRMDTKTYTGATKPPQYGGLEAIGFFFFFGLKHRGYTIFGTKYKCYGVGGPLD